jgi:ketosteroid isomerase-like protein
MKTMFTLFLGLVFLAGCSLQTASADRAAIEEMVRDHALAWETGDRELLDSLLHEDSVFAYPGRRLNKAETLEDLDYFAANFVDTKVYINTIIVEGNQVAVEWQFATTSTGSGARQVVSDAIIAEVKDGQFIVWKEYLDGRVKTLQESGELYFEEGEEPFPWPMKTDLYGTVKQ